jgi:hypothetical protein
LIGPISLPAEQVRGQLQPRLGPPINFHVTTVHELSGWKVCLSAGGYGADGLTDDETVG